MKSFATTQQGAHLRARPRMLASASRACGLLGARSAMVQPEIFGRSLLRPLSGLGLSTSRSFTASPLAAAAADKQPAAKQAQQKQPKGNAAKGGKSGGRGKGKDGEDPQGGPYSATVTLPVTDFSLRANSVVREPQIQAFWEQSQVYEQLASNNPGAPFTLHDGPPYANGDLHIGHALNKILKDIINRYQLLRGKRARFVPGWDTHGLPIELKVLTTLSESERKSIGTTELRAKAKEFALKTIDAQREQFKRYGIWGDWASPYVTLQPAYEAAQLAVFGKMFLNGHIYRGRKPVHWSPSSRTALAEAELEYPEGHKSRSIYVAMPIEAPSQKLEPGVADHMKGAGFAIWTTTPWTIPANLAVAVNGSLTYALVAAQGEGCQGWSCKKLIVAEDLVPKLKEKLGVDFHIIARFPGSALEGATYRHPLFDRVSPVVIGGDYITTDTGTGLVHTAPGHGQEDYQVGLKYGLPLLSPVDDAGRFTEEAGPRFVGKNVQGDGNTEVVAALGEVGALLTEEAYEHKYPYDWRTKKPTIFRATSQWFASVEGFKAASLEAIRQVSWVPASGLARITAMTESRSDWCISRQRKWGVPIPVFYDTQTDEPLMTEETISHVTSLVRTHGSDCWWALPVEDLLPDSLKHLAPKLRKGEDTMDVWFDSGSSWAGVLQTVPGLTFPADLYLEGSDQHRGWFQSSLLTSVASNGVAPYKQVLTHGFVLDERGNKMSKSLGNVVDPRTVIQGGKDERKDPPYGADVLRMWVASVDYSSDVMIGPGILKQVADQYRKIRGTLRFVLGNLHGFDPAKHSVPYDQLPALDKYMLSRLAAFQGEVAAAYESYGFRGVSTALMNLVVKDLSSFYLDIAKDRLYIQAQDHPARRSCQTVLHALLKGLLAAVAPIAPHMAEDAWLATPEVLRSGLTSVFQGGWAKPDAQWASLPQEEARKWAAIRAIRDAVNGTIEKARIAQQVGASLEARVLLHVGDPALAAALKDLDSRGNGVDELRTLFIVSQVELVPDAAAVRLAPFHDTLSPSTSSSSSTNGSSSDSPAEGQQGSGSSSDVLAGDVTIGVARAVGNKCGRCWNYSTLVGSVAEYPDLCERCHPVVVALGFKPPQQAASAETALPAAAKQTVGAA